MPHQYRHILGWFRLINELREHDIRTICVFDGDERTAAKSNEVCAPLTVTLALLTRCSKIGGDI